MTTELPRNIIVYAELLKESNTCLASHWTINFIQQCADWCIYIETGLSVLNDNDRNQCITDTQNQFMSEGQIPSLKELLQAQYHFYKVLLESKYISNQAYYFILSRYHFLTRTDENLLVEDLSELANKSTERNILMDILNDLNKH